MHARQPVLEDCHMSRRVPLITSNATLRLFHPPNLQPTRFRQRHALQVMYDDIVPDSEPEREEQRRSLDEKRRAKRTGKTRAPPESTRSMSFVLSSSPEPDLSTLFDLSFRRMAQLPERAAVDVVKENPSQAVRCQKCH